MESFVLQVGGQEYRLALPTERALEAEKQLGFSILSALDNADRVSVQSIMLWAALQKYNHGMTQQKTAALMNDMCGGFEMDGVTFEDFSVEARVKLVTKILTVGGFFTDATVAEINTQIAASDGNS